MPDETREQERSRVILMIIRTVLFIAGSLASMVAGFILARLLDPSSYAAIQTVTKRVVQYVAVTVILYETWVIRDTLREPSRITRQAVPYLVLSVSVGFLSGLILIYSITGSLIYALLAALGGGLLGARAVLGLILDAIRPLRTPLVIASARLVYLGGIIGLVQILRTGLFGALISFVVRTLIMVIAFIYYLRRILKRVERRVVRTLEGSVARLRASILRLFVYLIPNIDIPIVLVFVRDNVLISGFFISRLIPFTLVDITRNSFRFLQVAPERGWTNKEILDAIRISVGLAIPVLAFTFVYSDHVICFLNCIYLWSLPMLKLFSIEVVFLLVAIALENTYLGHAVSVSKSRHGHAVMVSKLYKQLLLPQILYILILLSGLVMYDKLGLERMGIVWAVGVLVMTIIYNFIIIKNILDKTGKILIKLYITIILYLILSLIMARFIPWINVSPSQKFLEELRVLAPSATLYYIVMVTVLLTIDRDARKILISLISSRKAG